MDDYLFSVGLTDEEIQLAVDRSGTINEPQEKGIDGPVQNQHGIGMHHIYAPVDKSKEDQTFYVTTFHQFWNSECKYYRVPEWFKKKKYKLSIWKKFKSCFPNCSLAGSSQYTPSMHLV